MTDTTTSFWAYVILANMYILHGKHNVGMLFLVLSVICLAIGIFKEVKANIKEKNNG